MKPLVIRADASTEIGSGHVMRCLALAEAWQDAGGKVLFVFAKEAPALEKRITSEGMDITHIPEVPGSISDAVTTIRIAQEFQAEWIVVDGYHFSTGYQKLIKDSGLSLLFIDDYGHADHYYANIVLNQNIYAARSIYSSIESGTILLLGTQYALIRREFLRIGGPKERNNPPAASKILVTFGGSDAEKITFYWIEVLQQIMAQKIEVIVVIGGSNPDYDIYRQLLLDQPGFSIRQSVDTMPELMEWADIAISAGGSTVWELAYMGVPSIIQPIADNQKPTADCLRYEGIALVVSGVADCDPHTALVTVQNFLASPDIRDRMSRKMKALVDGQGTDRIILRMTGNRIRLRNAERRDCRLLWIWVNDSHVRKSAFNQKQIDFADHQVWFEKKQKDPDCFQYIALNVSDIPVGQIRFDRHRECAEIDVCIAPEWRNQGLSSELIKLGCERLFRTTHVRMIQAHVKAENTTSVGTFERAGFSNQGKMIMHGYDVIYLTKRNPDAGCGDHE
jgi:UDP-2,4-diacetamido-2,4,6-trideoxy-beta-L-altropyranose hydrolase